MANIIYDIKDFTWNNSTNTFYAPAWYLTPVHGNYRCAFPNQKEQFFIQNFETENFRRFRFVSGDEYEWKFVSEDGINCVIAVAEETPIEMPIDLWNKMMAPPPPKNFFQKIFSVFSKSKTKK